MSLKLFETKWKTALTSILEELTESQFRKLMFDLAKIPQGVKMDKTREEIPYIIIQYYGTEGSISVIDKEMKQLPRNDAAVQEHLRPFVEKLKKQRQKEKKTTTKNESASGLVAKKQKPAAVVTMSKPAADSGSVTKKRKPAAETMSSSVSALGSVSKKQKPAAVTMSKPAADSGSMAKKQKPAADSGSMAKKQKPAADSGSMAKKQKPAADSGSMAKKQKPAAVTMSKPAADSGSMAMNQKPAADHVGVVKQKTEKPALSTKTSQVPSAPVQTGRIKILKLKMSNKTNTHLEVEFNNQMQTFFITTRLLANTLGFRADDDLALRLYFELPITADAKIQGNKIIEIKKL